MRVSASSFQAAAFVVAAALLAVTSDGAIPQSPDAWTRDFPIDPAEFVSRGSNPYFTIEPGHRHVLEGGTIRLQITVLDQTRRIEGVETRVVEERETDKGNLVEISRNYFAMNTRTNSIYYFGEDVDLYKNGKIASHNGAWLAGVGGARPGVMMPGLPLIGARYYQEIAPGVAMDRAEIASLTDTVKTPAGVFTNVLRTTETTPLEPRLRDAKYYARGVGLIRDGSLLLTSSGR